MEGSTDPVVSGERSPSVQTQGGRNGSNGQLSPSNPSTSPIVRGESSPSVKIQGGRSGSNGQLSPSTQSTSPIVRGDTSPSVRARGGRNGSNGQLSPYNQMEKPAKGMPDVKQLPLPIATAIPYSYSPTSPMSRGKRSPSVKSRGGRNSSNLLSTTHPFYCGMIDDLPEGVCLETPLTKKRRRVFEPKSEITPPESLVRWDSLDLGPPKPKPSPTKNSPRTSESPNRQPSKKQLPMVKNGAASNRFYCGFIHELPLGKPLENRSQNSKAKQNKKPKRKEPKPAQTNPSPRTPKSSNQPPEVEIKPSVAESSFAAITPESAEVSCVTESLSAESSCHDFTDESLKNMSFIIVDTPIVEDIQSPPLLESSEQLSFVVLELPSEESITVLEDSKEQPFVVLELPSEESITVLEASKEQPDSAVTPEPSIENASPIVNTPKSSKRLSILTNGGNPPSRKSLAPKRLFSEPNTAEVKPFYGSEEEYEEEDEDTGPIPLLLPRTVREFLKYDELLPISQLKCDCVINYDWPPISQDIKQESTTFTEDSTDTLDTLLPKNKFDFEWRAIPQPQISPEMRRENFSHISGPTESYDTPYDAFTAYWDMHIMEHIVIETNRYAYNKFSLPNNNAQWVDTNVDELYVYFAVILATGLVVKGKLEDYWNLEKDIFSTPEFSTVMDYERFVLLNKCIHFANNEDCDISIKLTDAKLFKIRPILDHLNNKFSTLYNMKQNVALDRSLTMWKGIELNQFMNDRESDIKTYEVCESETGYLWRFIVKTDVNTVNTNPDEDSKTVSLMLELLHGLENKGHTIFMDSHYTTPTLARELKIQGFDCVGTLKVNSENVPKELSSLEAKETSFGHVYGCTSGDVDVIICCEKKRAYISTYHGFESDNSNITLKPTVIQDYSLNVEKLDRKDKILAAFQIEHKQTKVWYKKMFRRLLNVSVFNAYILHSKEIGHRHFRRNLVNQILAKHSCAMSPALCLNEFRHFPKLFKVENSIKTKPCVICRKRTSTYCKGCDEMMCMFHCFEIHHTEAKTIKN